LPKSRIVCVRRRRAGVVTNTTTEEVVMEMVADHGLNVVAALDCVVVV
jgi:hypothetical protein